MLDRRCASLLKIINNECQNSGYKIFSVEELILSMPNGLTLESYEIIECIKILANHEYISVKYQDDSEICLCPLTKGRLVFESEIEQELEKTKDRKTYFLFSMLGAFLGGFLSSVITFILLAILGVI